MATLAADAFTGTDGAALSSTWTTGSTPTGGSALIHTNAGRLINGSTSGARISRRVNVTAPANAVARFRFQFPTFSGDIYPQFWVRSTNTALDTQGGYRIEFDEIDGNWNIATGTSYSINALTADTAGPVTFTFSRDTWYWCVFGVVGSAVKAKIWADGSTEPAWQKEVTDTTVTAAGSVGFTLSPGSGNQVPFDIDDFTLATTFPITADIKNSFEGGTSGTTISTSNSGGTSGTAFDAVVLGSSTLTYSNAWAAHGTLSALFTATASDTLYLEYGALNGSLYVRYHNNFSAVPAANTNIFRILNGSTILATIRINTTGKLAFLYSSGSLGATSTNSVTTGARIEAFFDAVNGAVTVRLYNSPDSTTITETLSVSSVSLGSNLITSVRVGIVSSAVWTLGIDDFGISATTWLGPAVTITTVTGGATLSTAVGLSAGGSDTAISGAALSTAVALSAAGSATELAGAVLSTAVALSAAGTRAVPGGAGLSTLVALVASSGTSAALSTHAALSAAGSTTELAGVALSVHVALAAAGPVTELAGAGLHTAVTLLAAGARAVPGGAGLSTAVVLVASPGSGAALVTISGLSAAGSTASVGTAGLSTAVVLSAAGIRAGVPTVLNLSTHVTLLAIPRQTFSSGALLSTAVVLVAIAAVTTPPLPIRGRYRVFARNAALQVIGEVDDYLTMTATRVYNDAGSWSLQLSGVSKNADLLDPSANPGGGIIIIRDGVIFLTGPISSDADDWSDGANDVLTFSGTCDNIWLFTRLIYPDPTKTPETMSASFYRASSANISAIMVDLVNKNMGPGALAGRRLAHLVLPSGLTMGSSQASPKYRFDLLGEALQKLSVLAQLGTDPTTQLQFQLQQSGTTLPLTIDNGAGKAGTVKFSKNLGTISSYSVTRTAPTATDLILGAGLQEVPDDASGVRVARGLFEYTRADAVFPRWAEQFVDVGIIDPTTGPTADIQQQLDQQAQDTFDTAAGQIGATIVPRETSQLGYGSDYRLGDFCTVILPRVTFTERIREVSLTVDASQAEQITVSVGTTDGEYTRRTRGAYRRLSTLADYIRRLKTGK